MVQNKVLQKAGQIDYRLSLKSHYQDDERIIHCYGIDGSKGLDWDILRESLMQKVDSLSKIGPLGPEIYLWAFFNYPIDLEVEQDPDMIFRKSFGPYRACGIEKTADHWHYGYGGVKPGKGNAYQWRKVSIWDGSEWEHEQAHGHQH